MVAFGNGRKEQIKGIGKIGRSDKHSIKKCTILKVRNTIY